MCILAILKNPCENVAFALAFNRDEFYARPTQRLHHWSDFPEVVGGRDEVAGGTWLAVTKSGDFAAILNYRDPALLLPNPKSRGLIVNEFLTSGKSIQYFLSELQEYVALYNHFTLVAGNFSNNEIFAYNSFEHKIIAIENTVTVFSNGICNANWPKQQRLAENIVNTKLSKETIIRDLMALLKDPWRPKPQDLPKTGISIEREKLVSSIFIASPRYGTCSSSIVIWDGAERISFVERNFNPLSTPEDINVSWNIQPKTDDRL